jgi:hypothetical protein
MKGVHFINECLVYYRKTRKHEGEETVLKFDKYANYNIIIYVRNFDFKSHTSVSGTRTIYRLTFFQKMQH